MRGQGFLLALFLIISTQVSAQESWYARAEAGPLFSMSYSVQNRYATTETDLQHQFGFSGGKRMGNSYFSVETGFFRQSHSTIATLETGEMPAGSKNASVRNQFSVYKIPVRASADLLPAKNKVGVQLTGGMSYLFKPGKRDLGQEIPSETVQVRNEQTGRTATVTSRHFLAGAWGIEAGVRASYAVNKQWAVELSGMFQAGLRNLATTTVTYEDLPAKNDPKFYSRGDATSVLLSVRYNFSAD